MDADNGRSSKTFSILSASIGRYRRLLLCVSLTLSLGGCAIGLYEYPAKAVKVDPETSFPAFKTSEVYFFLSKEAFPGDLQSIPVATLLTPWEAEWTYEQIIQEFQKKAAEVGANAIVFEDVQSSNQQFGYRIFRGRATAYRLFKASPSEDVDLSSSEYGTQTPDLQKVK